jgi:hypothetical protein
MPTPHSIRITDEMLDLWRRGCELQAAGHDDSDDDSAEHDEFVRISKRLNWSLIGVVTLSVFDRGLDGDPPSYATPAHAIYQDWATMQSWRRALQAALEAASRQSLER